MRAGNDPPLLGLLGACVYLAGALCINPRSLLPLPVAVCHLTSGPVLIFRQLSMGVSIPSACPFQPCSQGL